MKHMNAFLAVMATVLVLQFGIASAQSGALSIANLDVTPQPVYAGGNATISFQLYNSYTSELTNVNLELTGSYPLLNYSPAMTQLLTTVPTGMYGGTYLFTYTLHVPKDVKSGTYSLDLEATYQTTSGSSNVQETSSASMPISFYIRGVPDLNVAANPTEAISPGSESAVGISIINVGTDNATNASITLGNSNNFSIAGGAEFNLGTISPGSTSVASAMLLANATLKGGYADLPVTLTYHDQYGSEYTYNELVPISVSIGSPEIEIGIENANPPALYPGTNQTLLLSLQNIGSGAAKNVTVSALSNSNITVGDSASRELVGSVNAGASASASLFITANKNANGSRYYLPVSISYQNSDYNRTFTKTEMIPITLQPIAQFNVTEVAGGVPVGSTYVPVTLDVKNTGNEEAQSIVFSLQTIYPISQVNPNAYVSALEPGQSTAITFYVNVNTQASPGQYPITLYEQWSQPSGSGSQQYSGSQNYYINVSGQGGSYLTDIFIFAVIVIAVFAVYRRRKAASAAGRHGSLHREKK